MQVRGLIDVQTTAKEEIRLAWAGIDIVSIEVIHLQVKLLIGRYLRRRKERDSDNLSPVHQE